MTDEPEEWRPIPGREEYEVSDLGRVRRGDRILNGTRTGNGCAATAPARKRQRHD